MTNPDKRKMRILAKEGKPISRIMEDFPGESYWDIYFEVYGNGERSALGVKRMISNRLNQVVDATKQERKRIVDELNGLVWHLYDNHKANQKKLQAIRKTLGE